jgi:hypothetical protein
MSTTITVNVTIVPVTCYKCGVLFGVPDAFKEKRLRDRQEFYCPNGHAQHYVGKTEEQRLRDQLAQQKHVAEQAQARATEAWQYAEEERLRKERALRRLSATQGVVTRNKRRIAAGQCPCCSASFKDLKSHMTKRHPHWNPEREIDVRGGAL